MKTKEVNPVWFVATIVVALALCVGAGFYFTQSRDSNPVPPGGYKTISKEDFAAKRAQQMRDYMNSQKTAR